MKKIFGFVCVAALLSGCGDFVDVPPSTTGILLTSNGYAPGLIPPSKLRINRMCLRVMGCIKSELVIVDNGDSSIIEVMDIVLPKSELTVTFDLRVILGISPEEAAIRQLVSRIPPNELNGQKTIRFEQVYDIYGKAVVRDIARQIVSEYTIEEIVSSRPAINEKIDSALKDAMSRTPLNVLRASISDFPYPESIKKSFEKNQQRRIELVNMDNENAIELKRLQIELDRAEKEREVRMKMAEIDIEIGELTAKVVTPEWIKYRELEIMEKLVDSGEGRMIVPFGMLDDMKIGVDR